MKPSNQYLAWIDGLLSPAEAAQFEATLSPDALEAARQERRGQEELGALLRTHLAAPPLPNADFFTHAILEEIRRETPAPGGPPEEAPTFSWGFFWRLFSASAACVAISLVFFAALTSSRGVPGYYAEFVNPQPVQGVSAASFHAPDENVTVLWLDGLDYVPATAMNTISPSGGTRR